MTTLLPMLKELTNKINGVNIRVIRVVYSKEDK